MSIKHLAEKIKPLYYPFLALVLGSILLSLWQLFEIEQSYTPLKITYPGQSASVLEAFQGGGVIGSKTGGKYYFPWCGTVKIIKPENRVYFDSVEDARGAGYIPALNCKGLK